MPIHFFDASALVKAYREESGTNFVVDLIGTSPLPVVSRLGVIETSAAIVRRGRGTGMSIDEIQALLRSLDRDLRVAFEISELTPFVLMHALELTRHYGLRASDALQLAGALFTREDSGDEVFVVSSDAELNAAATAEGFHVIDPTQP
jgi:predicted nucleic acid-binding protein